MCTGEADYFRDYKRLGAIAKLATSYEVYFLHFHVFLVLIRDG
jgi:hypothetical protein